MVIPKASGQPVFLLLPETPLGVPGESLSSCPMQRVLYSSQLCSVCASGNLGWSPWALTSAFPPDHFPFPINDHTVGSLIWKEPTYSYNVSWIPSQSSIICLDNVAEGGHGGEGGDGTDHLQNYASAYKVSVFLEVLCSQPQKERLFICPLKPPFS